VRQVPRRLWQPDHEAEACSLMACGKKFGSWYRARKHHCRQCGRVVCGPCSARMVLPARVPLCIVILTSCGPLPLRLPRTNPEMLPTPWKNLMDFVRTLWQKVLLPPKGEKGPPRNVRVCEACFLSHETFSFPRTVSAGYLCGSPGSMGSNGSIDTFPASRDLASPVVPTRRIARLKESSSSPAILQQFQKVLSLKVEGSEDKAAAVHHSPMSANEAAANSPEVVSAAETQAPDSPSSDSKSFRGTSSPMRVPRGQAEDATIGAVAVGDETAAQRLLQDVALQDDRRKEWIANVQKKFGADPHYHVSHYHARMSWCARASSKHASAGAGPRSLPCLHTCAACSL
jgi:hypothetical protein